MKGAKQGFSQIIFLNTGGDTDITQSEFCHEWVVGHILPAALEIERRLRRFMDGYIAPFIAQQQYCNAACDRFLALLGGWTDVGPRMRWPYRSIPAVEVERLRPVLREKLPEFAVERHPAVTLRNSSSLR